MYLPILLTTLLAMPSLSVHADYVVTPADKIMRYLGAFSPRFDNLAGEDLDRALMTFAEIFSIDYFHQSGYGTVEKWSENMLSFLEGCSRPHWPLEPARQAVLDDLAARDALRAFFRTHAAEIKAAYDAAETYYHRRKHLDRALLFADGASNELRMIDSFGLILGTGAATVVGAGVSFAVGNPCGLLLAATPAGYYWGRRWLRHLSRGPRLAHAQREARPALLALKKALNSIDRDRESDGILECEPARATVTDLDL